MFFDPIIGLYSFGVMQSRKGKKKQKNFQKSHEVYDRR